MTKLIVTIYEALVKRKVLLYLIYEVSSHLIPI